MAPGIWTISAIHRPSVSRSHSIESLMIKSSLGSAYQNREESSALAERNRRLVSPLPLGEVRSRTIAIKADRPVVNGHVVNGHQDAQPDRPGPLDRRWLRRDRIGRDRARAFSDRQATGRRAVVRPGTR